MAKSEREKRWVTPAIIHCLFVVNLKFPTFNKL